MILLHKGNTINHDGITLKIDYIIFIDYIEFLEHACDFETLQENMVSLFS